MPTFAGLSITAEYHGQGRPAMQDVSSPKEGMLPPIASPTRPGREAPGKGAGVHPSGPTGRPWSRHGDEASPRDTFVANAGARHPSPRLPPIGGATRLSMPDRVMDGAEFTIACQPDADQGPERRESYRAEGSRSARKMLTELSDVARLPIKQKMNRCVQCTSFPNLLCPSDSCSF